MNVAPGFSVCATLNALRTISGTISRLADLRRIFGDRLEQLHEVEDLVAFLVQPCGRPLSRNGHDGCTIHVGVGDAGNEVRRPRTQSRQANARTSGEPPVDVCHEGRALLMARGDETDGAVEERIQHVDVLFAGHAEDVLNLLILETSNEKLCGGLISALGHDLSLRWSLPMRQTPHNRRLFTSNGMRQ